MTKLEVEIKKDNYDYLRLMSIGLDKDISTVVDGMIDFIAYFVSKETKIIEKTQEQTLDSMVFYKYVNGSFTPPSDLNIETLRKEILREILRDNGLEK